MNRTRIPKICWPLLILLLLLMTACGEPKQEVDLTDPQLAQGKALYETHCAECHGNAGEGEPNWKRPDENGIMPAPPHDSSGHTWHHPDSQLIQVIAEGSGMPKSKMPAYQAVLTEAEIEAVLAYIKTFLGERERAFQEQVTQQRGN